MEPDTTSGISGEPALVSRKPYFSVLICGIVTSVLTLAGVYWLSNHDFHIMGWYANYVIPMGALIVGMVAGCGYAIGSWMSGIRIGSWLLWTVLLLQASAYVGAEYVEYRDVMARFQQQAGGLAQAQNLPTFFEYYDFKARNFAWKKKDGQGAGEPLGVWGYFFVLLGAAGFIGGGLLGPAILIAVPYCDSCQRYMSRKVLGVLPAAVADRKISKKDTEALDAFAVEQQQAFVRANEASVRLNEAMAAKNVEALRQELSAAGPAKKNNKLAKRIEVSLTWCKGCDQGRITTTLVTGQGKQLVRQELNVTTIAPEFVQGILVE